MKTDEFGSTVEFASGAGQSSTRASTSWDGSFEGPSEKPRTFREVVKDADIVLATLGATTALAGFTLVFLGVIIARYEESLKTLPGASRRVRVQFRGPAGGLLCAFMLGLSAIAVSFAWLVARGGHSFYVLVIVLFAAQLLSTALASGYVTRDVLIVK